MSKDSQNEFLSISAKLVLKGIIDEINEENNGFFSLIVDEARDVSTKEQMSVCVRYTNKTKLLERFLGFVELTKLSAKSLFLEISQFLENSGLNIIKCIGQAYNGASVISGHLTGVNVLVREVAENPCVYVHCYAHRLNLILIDTAKNVKLVDDTLGLLEAIYAFQSAPTLRHQKFRDAQEREDPKKRIFEMPQQSDTRWVSKYKGVMYFKNNFLSVLSVLDSFTTSSNKMEAASAKGFLMQLKEFDVIFALHFLGEILHFSNTVSTSLQKEDLLMGSAVKIIDGLKKTLENRRTESFFNECWEKASSLANKMGITVPCNEEATSSKRLQKISSKFSGSIVMSPTGQRDHLQKASFKKIMFEMIDHMKSELERRFIDNSCMFDAFECLNPTSTEFMSWESIHAFTELYSKFVDEGTAIKYEMELAKQGSVTAFADDTALSYSADDRGQLAQMISEDLKKLNLWLQRMRNDVIDDVIILRIFRPVRMTTISISAICACPVTSK
ncbi:zinc finger MYM-type protein 1-like [Nilaparvata lugens]|uniref:zinc finger MYM-type protein 1-like n=1 Tax=Nilaparvata lugens TaxID=108931 RepID=UPI00193E81AC|nr:zinc finger MYM-type protein 1-like [Nilaparvata lugens]